VAQFLDARLLLGQQPLAQDGRRCRRDAVIERARRAQIMILDGTQPTFTQVPPMVPRSISVTRAPCSTALSAAAIAAPPLPMTAMCSLSLP
jgi:hypothetical protein